MVSIENHVQIQNSGQPPYYS